MVRFAEIPMKRDVRLIICFVSLLNATSAVAQVPEFYGVYARDRGRLVRMEVSAKDVKDVAIGSDTSFIIYEKWVSQTPGVPLNQAVALRRLYYIRNHVMTTPLDGFYPQSRTPTKPVNKWGAENSGQPLPILMKPVKGYNEAVEIVPKGPLEPGVYSLRTLGNAYAFSVRFSDINNDNFCVDMYADSIGAVLGAASYRPCAAAPQAQPSQRQVDSPPTKGTPGRQNISTASLIQDGRREYLAKNWKEAEAVYQRVLDQDRDNFEATAQLGTIYFKLSDFEKSKLYLQKAMNLRPDDWRPYYNAACNYALMGESDRAIALLKQAVAKGFKDFEWMRKDPDLESIRNDPRFQSLSER